MPRNSRLSRLQRAITRRQGELFCNMGIEPEETKGTSSYCQVLVAASQKVASISLSAHEILRLRCATAQNDNPSLRSSRDRREGRLVNRG